MSGFNTDTGDRAAAHLASIDPTLQQTKLALALYPECAEAIRCIERGRVVVDDLALAISMITTAIRNAGVTRPGEASHAAELIFEAEAIVEGIIGPEWPAARAFTDPFSDLDPPTLASLIESNATVREQVNSALVRADLTWDEASADERAYLEEVFAWRFFGGAAGGFPPPDIRVFAGEDPDFPQRGSWLSEAAQTMFGVMGRETEQGPRYDLDDRFGYDELTWAEVLGDAVDLPVGIDPATVAPDSLWWSYQYGGIAYIDSLSDAEFGDLAIENPDHPVFRTPQGTDRVTLLERSLYLGELGAWVELNGATLDDILDDTEHQAWLFGSISCPPLDQFPPQLRALIETEISSREGDVPPEFYGAALAWFLENATTEPTAPPPALTSAEMVYAGVLAEFLPTQEGEENPAIFSSDIGVNSWPQHLYNYPMGGGADALATRNLYFGMNNPWIRQAFGLPPDPEAPGIPLELVVHMAAIPLGFVPILGEGIDLAYIGYDVSRGDWGSAAIGLAFLAIPFVGAGIWRTAKHYDEIRDALRAGWRGADGGSDAAASTVRYAEVFRVARIRPDGRPVAAAWRRVLQPNGYRTPTYSFSDAWRGSNLSGMPSYEGAADLRHVYFFGDVLDNPVMRSRVADLNGLPPEIRRLFNEHNTSFHFGVGNLGDLPAFHPYAFLSPRGYSSGSTGMTTTAAYAPTARAIGIGSGRAGSVNVVLHESGHALDHILGYISQQPYFTGMHQRFFDSTQRLIDNPIPGMPDFSYYRMADGAGASEWYAETFAAVASGNRGALLTLSNGNVGIADELTVFHTRAMDNPRSFLPPPPSSSLPGGGAGASGSGPATPSRVFAAPPALRLTVQLDPNTAIARNHVDGFARDWQLLPGGLTAPVKLYKAKSLSGMHTEEALRRFLADMKEHGHIVKEVASIQMPHGRLVRISIELPDGTMVYETKSLFNSTADLDVLSQQIMAQASALGRSDLVGPRSYTLADGHSYSATFRQSTNDPSKLELRTFYPI